MDSTPTADLDTGRITRRVAVAASQQQTWSALTDPAAIEQERDRTVRLPMAGGRHIGAQAVLVEVSTEDRHDLAQAHRKCPRVRRLAVPSLPTTR